MFVRELMTVPAISLSEFTPIAEAAKFLVEHGFTGAPVIDEDGALIGIVTEVDLIQGRIAPDPRRTPNHPRMSRRRSRAVVADVMTTPVESLTPGADAADAARMMVDERIRMIPIVDGVNIVGILTRRDLLRAGVARSDRDLEADILQHLRGSTDSERWRVTVQAGVAHIDDFLDHPAGRVEAEQLAAAVPGVVHATVSYLTSDPS